MEDLRIATIGTSMITGQFLEAVGLVDGITFAGAYSRSLEKAEEWSRAHGADRAWDNLDALAADDSVDAVYIASPNLLHAEQALKMIGGGKHVLVEKPLGTTRAEARRVFEAAREKGVVAMEAMRLVHDPAWRVVAENLHFLGTLRRASFPYGKYSSRYDKVLAGEQTNIFDPAFATGALMDIGIYPLNALVLMLGEPDDLMCFADTVDVTGDGGTIDLCGTVLFDYPDAVATVSYSKVTDDRLPAQIEGEKGTMIIDSVPQPRRIEVFYGDGSSEVLPVPGRKNRTDHEVGNMEFEVADFLAACRGELSLERLNENTLAVIGIMDTVRLREGIVFPHDEG